MIPGAKGLLTWEKSSVERFAVVQSLDSDREFFFQAVGFGKRKWNVWPEAK